MRAVWQMLVWSVVAGGCSLAAADIEFGQGGRPEGFKTDERGEPRPAIVVVDKALSRSAPKNTARSTQTLAFLDSFYVADVAGRPGDRYFLLGEMSFRDRSVKRLVGWVAEGDVLVQDKALKVPDNPGVYQKALVVNKWRTVEASRLTIEGAAVSNGPGRGYQVLRKLGLFDFYYVYKRTTGPDGVYLLLGNYHSVQNILAPGDYLIGWVPESRLVKWSTRQAVEFDKSTLAERKRVKGEDAGVRIFESEEMLVAHLQGRSRLGDEEVEPIANENITVERWPHTWQRFPLFAEKPSTRIRSARSLWHVGFIGDQIYTDGEVGAQRGNIDEERLKLKKIRKDLRNVDLVVVMDATGSMSPYFKSAAKAVKEIAEHLQHQSLGGAEGDIKLRVSVVFFRDYVDEDGKPDPTDSYLVKRLPLTENLDAVSQFLDAETIPDGAGGDNREAVFKAIDEAIGRTNANENGFRALLVVGDAGNHEQGFTPPPPYERYKEKTPEQISDLIEQAGYAFHYIHVVEEERARKDAVARTFREQMRKIAGLLMGSDSTPVTSEDPGEVAKAVVDAAKHEVEELRKGRVGLTKVTTGEMGLKDLKLQYGVQLTRRLTKLMEQRGVDPNMFVNASVQVFEEGWVAKANPETGLSQVRPVLLVERADITQLMGILASFTKDTPSRNAVLSVWTTALETQLGETDVKDRSPKEIVEGHLGLPIHNKVLALTFEKIANLPQPELVALWEELKVDLRMLHGISSERQLNVVETTLPNGKKRRTVQDLGTRKVWWQGDNCEYGWVGLDEMP